MLKLVQPGSMATSGIEVTAAGVIIGRERGCDVMLCSKNVSRQHARLVLRDKIACVEDLGSSNGTFVDGQQIKDRTELKPGSSVTFGDLTFFLIDDDVVPERRGQPKEEAALPNGTGNSLTGKNTGAAELRPVRRFACRKVEKDQAAWRKSGSRATQRSSSPKVRAAPTHSSTASLEKSHSSEVCAGLLIFMLLGGFALGNGVGRLGSLEFFGERSAMKNLVTPELSMEAPQPDSGDRSNAIFATSNQNNQTNLTEESKQAPMLAALGPPAQQLPDAETPGEMSINDSGKALKLMKEAQRLNVDMRDQEVLFQIATEKFGMTRDQAKRAVTFNALMAERKAIMDGGLDAIAKLKPAPRAQAAVASTPNALVTPEEQSLVSTSDTRLSQSPNLNDPNHDGTETTKTMLADSHDAKRTSAPNPIMMAAVKRGPGFYLNAWGLALVTGMLLAWRALVAWIGRDSMLLGEKESKCLGVCTVAGPAGALALLGCPDLGWGMMLNTAFIGVPLMTHLANRERQVPAHLQILRLQNWFGRLDTSDFGVDQMKQTQLELLRAAVAAGPNDAAGELRASDGPGLLAAKSLIASAIARRASEIHLLLDSDQFLARFLIDGGSRDGGTYSQSAGRRLTQVFQQLASNQTDRLGSFEGRFRVKILDESFDVLAVSDASRQNGLSIRLLRFQEELTNFSGLGCNRKIQGELRHIIAQPRGLFIVCGPDQSGKSTTLRSAVSELDTTVQKVIAIEDPLEYQISHITQIEVDRKAGQSMTTAMKSALQQEPGVLMVGEIRDQETAITACEAAKQGSLVLSSLNVRGTVSVIQQLADFGVERSVIADALTAVLGQRLIRRLCPICKVRYYPEADLLRRYRIPSDRDRILYSPPHRGSTPDTGSTCEACEGEGYRGRTGIFELLKIDSPIQAMIRDRASVSQIHDAARRRGMATLRESGFLIALRGVTSLEEVHAVTRSERS